MCFQIADRSFNLFFWQSLVENVKIFIGSVSDGQEYKWVYQKDSSLGGWADNVGEVRERWAWKKKTTEEVHGCRDGGHAEGLVWQKSRVGEMKSYEPLTPKGSSQKKKKLNAYEHMKGRPIKVHMGF